MIKKHLSYRPDVDGLRAIAVLAVVIFHVDAHLLPGGFVGVDIFFVISGFLISGLILNSLKAGSFSFVDFYVRRINRIFPALLLVVACALVFGWFALYETEFLELGNQSFSGLLFFPNFTLLKEVGYFDSANELKPLVHLWSLGVEEQFYFLWPFTLFLLRKSKIPFFVTLLGVISFGINLALVVNHRESAFYLPYGRFWEMLLGAALVSSSTDPISMISNHVKSILGLSLIILSFFMINQGRAFPGGWVLMPTLGTFLIISAGPNTFINRKVLSNPRVVFIGLISYPLYLWHWPFLYFVTVMARGVPYLWVRFAAVAIAGIFACLTYWIVEKPIRKLAPTKKFKSASALLLISIMLSFLSFDAWKDGNKNKSDPTLTLGENIEGLTVPDCTLAKQKQGLTTWCMTDKKGAANYAIIGDSHAHALFPGLVGVSSKDVHWTLIARAGCSPLLGIKRLDEHLPKDELQICHDLALGAARSLSENKNIRVVLMAMNRPIPGERFLADEAGSLSSASNEELYTQGLQNLITTLQESGKKVVLLIHNPDFGATPEFCFPRPIQVGGINAQPECMISRAQYDEQLALPRKIFKVLQQRLPKLGVFDPENIYCNQTECSEVQGGHSLYSHTSHLSDFGNTQVANAFMKWLNEVKGL